MRILSIETSCDETAVALLEISGKAEKPDIKILGNALLSQIHLHQQYGGVYPNLAKREHIKNLPILLEQCLREAGEDTENPNFDYIAVTQGPGLEPALWTGISFAEDLGRRWDKRVIPVNHMDGHIFSVLYGSTGPLELPLLALLVSGGHTELVLVNSFKDKKIIGRTLDDAVGEAYDKVARMLGLPYPGGPQISRLAEEAREKGLEAGFEFPRPMIKSGNLDFSFSGLKTSVLYKIRELDIEDQNIKAGIARAFEDAAIGVLTSKTRSALEENFGEVKTLIVAGGVSGNKYLQKQLRSLMEKFPETNLIFPDRLVTTDNAIMIGIAGFIKVNESPEILDSHLPIQAQGNLSLDSI